MLFNN